MSGDFDLLLPLRRKFRLPVAGLTSGLLGFLFKQVYFALCGTEMFNDTK